MIISGKQIQTILNAYSDNKSVRNVKTEKSTSLQQKDQVVLSSQAQEFAHILQSIKNSSEVREEKVKELAEKINSGNYKVTSQEVADKMIGRIMADNYAR